MKIIPIASDSLGVRSMATLVETKDCRIAIDPSAALGPSRYGLPPSPQEEEALKFYLGEAHKAASESDVIVISHYHFDHFDLSGSHFENKTVYAKDVTRDINKSQIERGTAFKENVGGLCEIIYADGKEFVIGDTVIRFSPASAHGPAGIRLGFVLMTTVKEGGKTFLHASDVQGPVVRETAGYIIREHPDVLYMDGPPTLFLGWKFSYKNLEEAKENLLLIQREVDPEIILDHHLLRDLRYRELMGRVYDNEKVKSAAEVLGKENRMLEAHRKELWDAVKH
ncbi:MAG: MBL fold metallo-hydrolase [Candidatus Altiarchaeota archaeon]|nr:MBL fold metallo-hydrolase [Candidatus Altiarchaeota archaeon]